MSLFAPLLVLGFSLNLDEVVESFFGNFQGFLLSGRHDGACLLLLMLIFCRCAHLHVFTSAQLGFSLNLDEVVESFFGNFQGFLLSGRHDGACLLLLIFCRCAHLHAFTSAQLGFSLDLDEVVESFFGNFQGFLLSGRHDGACLLLLLIFCRCAHLHSFKSAQLGFSLNLDEVVESFFGNFQGFLLSGRHDGACLLLLIFCRCAHLHAFTSAQFHICTAEIR